MKDMINCEDLCFAWAESPIFNNRIYQYCTQLPRTADHRKCVLVGRSWLEPHCKWNWASKLNKDLKLSLDLKIVVVHNLSFSAFFSLTAAKFFSGFPPGIFAAPLLQLHTQYSVHFSKLHFFRWTYRERINNSLQYQIGITVNNHLADQSRLF